MRLLMPLLLSPIMWLTGWYDIDIIHADHTHRSMLNPYLLYSYRYSVHNVHHNGYRTADLHNLVVVPSLRARSGQGD